MDFTIAFSEPVTGVTADDFVVTTTGAISGAFVAEVLSSGTDYIVAVNTGSGDGTICLDLIDNDSIADSQGELLGGPGAGNAFPYINVRGITQLRLRFQLDDNHDLADDYLRFYSGDSNDLTTRPRLLIEYYTTR